MSKSHPSGIPSFQTQAGFKVPFKSQKILHSSEPFCNEEQVLWSLPKSAPICQGTQLSRNVRRFCEVEAESSFPDFGVQQISTVFNFQ